MNYQCKCNIDATLFSDQGCFGVGMCLRNSRGYFITALIKWYDNVPPPLSKGIGLMECYFMAWWVYQKYILK